jgi:hypothetical protein
MKGYTAYPDHPKRNKTSSEDRAETPNNAFVQYLH